MTRGVIGATLVLALLSGCRRTVKAEEPNAELNAKPVAEPTPTMEEPPTTTPPPEEPVSQGEMPTEIPREALAYRDNFIRIWRFYFALAESPTIGFAQVHQESAWKTDAKSVYASGLAQFTPATAADYSRILPAEVQATCPHKAGCPTDPNWALHALSLYDYNLHRSHAWAKRRTIAGGWR